MNRSVRLGGLAIAVILIVGVFVASLPVFAAYNTRPEKKYPTLLMAEIVSGDSADVEIALGFSNNVGAISEIQEGRYDMIGINERNLTKFSMADSDGVDIPITVSPHPSAAMHTDESKYFYISADSLNVDETYTIHIEEDLYANMGNSLGVPYDVTFCIGESNIDFQPLGTLPVVDIVEILTFASASVETNAVNVPINSTFTLTFSHNISGVDVLEFNSRYIKLYQGATEVPVRLVPAPDDDVKSIILEPLQSLQYGLEYKIMASTNVMARNGNYLSSPVAVYFTTQIAPADPQNPENPENPEQPQDPENPEEPQPEQPQNPEQPGGKIEIYFSDVANCWALNDISYLAELGVVNGTPDGRFNPNDDVSRAEAVTMLVRAFNIIDSGKSSPFTDITNHWAKSYIEAAYAAGMVTGTSAVEFSPAAEITREEFVVMIVRVASLSLDGKISPIFADADKVSAWAKEEVEIAAANGLIGGYNDGSFAPQNMVNRAEASRIMANCLRMKQFVE